MARKLRVEYPGAIYHLMNRGDRRESIFKDDEDRQRFLGTLGEACVKTGWQVHAYCLMSNQSFSSSDRNSAGQSGQGNEMAFGCLHLPVQPAAQAVWQGWTEEDLRVRRKGDVFKVRLAQRLRVETTVTLKWIAERLRMGTRGHLTHLLYWRGRKKPLKKPASVKYAKTID